MERQYDKRTYWNGEEFIEYQAERSYKILVLDEVDGSILYDSVIYHPSLEIEGFSGGANATLKFGLSSLNLGGVNKLYDNEVHTID